MLWVLLGVLTWAGEGEPSEAPVSVEVAAGLSLSPSSGWAQDHGGWTALELGARVRASERVAVRMQVGGAPGRVGREPPVAMPTHVGWDGTSLAFSAGDRNFAEPLAGRRAELALDGIWTLARGDITRLERQDLPLDVGLVTGVSALVLDTSPTEPSTVHPSARLGGLARVGLSDRVQAQAEVRVNGLVLDEPVYDPNQVSEGRSLVLWPRVSVGLAVGFGRSRFEL